MAGNSAGTRAVRTDSAPADSAPTGSESTVSAPVPTDIVFDFCGVLIDRQVTQTLTGSYPPEKIASYFAYDDRSGFHYYDDLLDNGMDIEEACARYEAERGPELAGMFRCYYDNLARGLVRMVPGMLDLLRDLRSAGVRLWGLTNWAAGSWHCAYERFPELADLLRDVVVSGCEGVSKPDSRIYHIAVERFGFDPSRTVFVDDNAINVSAARAEGMVGLPFIDASHARRDLRALGIAVPAGDEGPGTVLGRAGSALPEERLVHDGASVCDEADEEPGISLLVPNNGDHTTGVWRAVRLGDLVLPDASDPRSGAYASDFWISRHSEYNALQWHRIDWTLVRRELARVAARLSGHPEELPQLELEYRTIRERTFLEMWFGYGDPCCEAFPMGDGRYRIGYGQHRICPVANYPLPPEAARLMKLAGGAFTPGELPLPEDALLPMLVIS